MFSSEKKAAARKGLEPEKKNEENTKIAAEDRRKEGKKKEAQADEATFEKEEDA